MTPREWTTKEEVRKFSAASRPGERLAFVPTMGALHEGHLDLVRRARELADRTIVSIFVNPTQFGPNEDFDAYPRTREADLEKLGAVGVDAVWFPEAASMYPDGFATHIEVPALANRLCGLHRPGHFAGVCVVVLKLFQVVRPDVAVFGRKDYQQLAIIRRMVRDLDLDIEIADVETRRETDGLAMSSRNVRLTPEGRERALSLSRGLLAAQSLARGGERNGDVLVRTAREILDPKVDVEYLELVDADSLESVPSIDRAAVLLVAAHVDGVRLIDNVELGRPDAS